MQAGVLTREAHRAGAQHGVPLAGDDENALQVAEGLVRDAGFDPLVVGPAAHAKGFDEGTPVWNNAMSADELRTRLEV